MVDIVQVGAGGGGERAQVAGGVLGVSWLSVAVLGLGVMDDWWTVLEVRGGGGECLVW